MQIIVVLYAKQIIHIKNEARLGAGVKIYDNDFHDLYHNNETDGQEIVPAKEVLVGENAFIGAGSI